MGKTTGFIEFDRQQESYLPVQDRVTNYKEFVLSLSDQEAKIQGARCMDCGIPFCMSGCPINNIIPDWNDLVYRQDWRQAIDVLHSTNNFPEFTGRICPAPCEAACTLNINNDAVGIKSIEHAIIDRAWEKGWIVAELAIRKTGKKVAVIGSGPAGMAAAQQLARAGHSVVLLEKNDRIGGLLRYGIPDFKLEKFHIERRMEQMHAEGVEFRVNQHVGVNVSADYILKEFDAVILAAGAEQPRDLAIPGRELNGIHFAMEFLTQQNKVNAGDTVSNQIKAAGKHVIVIGGGDTGSDCVGTSNRHGAASVSQFEIMPQPPEQEDRLMVWPNWPIKLRTSSSHEEGCIRDWSIVTKRFEGENGQLKKLIAARVEWIDGKMSEISNSEFEMPADQVFLAMGFVSPVQKLLDAFAVEKDARGNVLATTDGEGCYATNKTKVFAAGDVRRGQSLVVWAIREGRQCAREVDAFLMGRSDLPR